MSDNNDGFVPSIQAKPDATQQKQNAVKPDSASVASPQKDSGGTSDGFVPSVRAKSKPSEESEQPSVFEKTDRAITSTLETNPENLKNLARTNLIEVPKTLGREIYSGIKTIGSMPGGIYHAFADEPTQEEREKNAQFEKENGEALGTETSGLKRIGLGIERMTGVPAAEEAVKTYANPKTRPSYEQVLNVAPEAIGQGAGVVTAAEVAPKIVRGVKEAIPSAISKVADITSKVKSPDTSTLGGVLTDEAKQYALRKIPGYDVVKTAKRIANKISDLKEAENASALGKPADELIPSRTAKPATDPNLVDNSYVPNKAAKPAGFKSILPEEPTAEAAPEELKPIGSKVAEPASDLKPIGKAAPEEAAEVRQARHVLGNVAVDKLKSVEGGPEALRRLTAGTYQQFADLANALDIKKPAYLAEKNGEAWQASEFKRTVKEHGKSLSGPKETVVRELLSKPPAEILQHTNPWVDSTAKYPAQMSSLTERTMKALGLTEEAKNNLRASGVSDAQAQSLLAKLTKRQLENLSETMEKGEHLPTVSGGSQGAELSPNASGESAASQEAINRTVSEKAKGTKYYRLDTRSGRAIPLIGPDRVDATAGDYEEIVKVGVDGTETTLDRGSKARPRLRSSKLIQ
jgi:hypothetical protein